MKSFRYVIRDSAGIHARPAGLLTKEAKKYESRIEICRDGKKAEATKLMALMGMGVKCGDEVEVRADGPDEEAACAGMRAFLEKNL